MRETAISQIGHVDSSSQEHDFMRKQALDSAEWFKARNDSSDNREHFPSSASRNLRILEVAYIAQDQNFIERACVSCGGLCTAFTLKVMLNSLIHGVDNGMSEARRKDPGQSHDDRFAHGRRDTKSMKSVFYVDVAQEGAGKSLGGWLKVATTKGICGCNDQPEEEIIDTQKIRIKALRFTADTDHLGSVQGESWYHRNDMAIQRAFITHLFSYLHQRLQYCKNALQDFTKYYT
ncbi:hypothetical protein F5884DRAFT_753431 [Xylogone sp. PMI_703]|nr:hypothetical protein F5884DRAFT_753431 [Xylogone sp. PMI_703]